MNDTRFFRIALVGVSLASAWALTACRGSSPASGPTTVSTYEVGESVHIGEDAVVTLVSVDSTPSWDVGHSSEPRSYVWLRFDTTNTSDASLTVPSEPLPPEIVDARAAGFGAMTRGVRLRGGGGGFGMAAVRRKPYLNPGGVMRTQFGIGSFESTGTPDRPFTVVYAPLGGDPIRFIVR